ncbi:hypothetical protein D3C72_1402260 [compost metagenome]
MLDSPYVVLNLHHAVKRWVGLHHVTRRSVGVVGHFLCRRQDDEFRRLPPVHLQDRKHDARGFCRLGVLLADQHEGFTD